MAKISSLLLVLVASFFLSSLSMFLLTKPATGIGIGASGETAAIIINGLDSLALLKHRLYKRMPE